MAENFKSLWVVWSMLSLSVLIAMVAAPEGKWSNLLTIACCGIHILACFAVIGIYFHG